VVNSSFPITATASCFAAPKGLSASYEVKCDAPRGNASWTVTAFGGAVCQSNRKAIELSGYGITCSEMELVGEKLYFQVNCGGEMIRGNSTSWSLTTTTTHAPTTHPTTTTRHPNTTQPHVTTTTPRSTFAPPPSTPVLTHASLLSTFHTGSTFAVSFSGRGASSTISLCLKRVANLSVYLCDVLLKDHLMLANGSGRFQGPLPSEPTGIYFVILGDNLTTTTTAHTASKPPFILDALVEIQAVEKTTTPRPCMCPTPSTDCSVSAQKGTGESVRQAMLMGTAVALAVVIGLGVRWWEWMGRI